MNRFTKLQREGMSAQACARLAHVVCAATTWKQAHTILECLDKSRAGDVLGQLACGCSLYSLLQRDARDYLHAIGSRLGDARAAQ